MRLGRRAALTTPQQRSVFLYSRLTVPHLIAGGGGNLVNIASISGLKGFAGASTYVATKFVHRLLPLT
jgi:NADP-dependent 3-hydroxy acid dehydrogenase YdfG